MRRNGLRLCCASLALTSLVSSVAPAQPPATTAPKATEPEPAQPETTTPEAEATTPEAEATTPETTERQPDQTLCTAHSKRAPGSFIQLLEATTGSDLPATLLSIELGETLCLTAKLVYSRLEELRAPGEVRVGSAAIRVQLLPTSTPNGEVGTKLTVDNPYRQTLRFITAAPSKAKGDSGPSQYQAFKVLTVPPGSSANWLQPASVFRMGLLAFELVDENVPLPQPLAADTTTAAPATPKTATSSRSAANLIAVGLLYDWQYAPQPELDAEFRRNGYTGLSPHRSAFGVYLDFTLGRVRLGLVLALSERSAHSGKNDLDLRIPQADMLAGYDFYQTESLSLFALGGLSFGSVLVVSPSGQPALFTDRSVSTEDDDIAYATDHIGLPILFGAEHRFWFADETEQYLAWGLRTGYSWPLSRDAWQLRRDGKSVRRMGRSPATSIQGAFVQVLLTVGVQEDRP